MNLQATVDVVDDDELAKRARAALDRIERSAQSMAQSSVMHREHWREYGAVLLEKRQSTPGNQAFNGWIVEQRLDQGAASTKGARADAMWMAAQWTMVHSLYHGNHNHPTNIRAECRKLGFAWAGKTEVTKEREAHSRRNRFSLRMMAVRIGLLPDNCSGQDTQRLRDKFAERWPEISVTPENETAILTALETLKAERHALRQEQIVKREATIAEADREALRKSLQREYAEKEFTLRTSIEAEVLRRLPTAERDHIARLQADVDSANELQRIWHHRAEVCVNACKLFMANWRAIAQLLHPDKATTDKTAQYANAFDIVQRTREALERTELSKW